jgi:uracil-DNA glycosylase
MVMQFGLFDERPQQFDSFASLLATMIDLEDDPLASAGTTMCIYRGNPEAQLMIVGEAPGPEENRLGKPFVGRSGQLLDKILTSVDFDPDMDVFITNAVFRMPPGDGDRPFRKPTLEEIEAYRPYLLEIIRLIDPLIIMLSGNVATQSLLGRTGITKLRGEWTQWNNRWLIPIFHPAYLLRNPTRQPGGPKSLTWRDFQEVRKKYDALTVNSGRGKAQR